MAKDQRRRRREEEWRNLLNNIFVLSIPSIAPLSSQPFSRWRLPWFEPITVVPKLVAEKTLPPPLHAVLASRFLRDIPSVFHTSTQARIHPYFLGMS